jgi:hypothetical protein
VAANAPAIFAALRPLAPPLRAVVPTLTAILLAFRAVWLPLCAMLLAIDRFRRFWRSLIAIGRGSVVGSRDRRGGARRARRDHRPDREW